MKSWILLLSATMLSGALFLFIFNLENENSKEETYSNQQTKKSSPVVINNKMDRSIAAIPPNPLKAKVKVQLVGLTPSDLGNFPQTNTRSITWKENFTKNFEKNRSQLGFNSFQIKHKRSILKKENKTSRNFEHIVVRYKLPNGNPFSFEALVDSETGTMAQSWNKTRYEKNEPTTLDGTNKLLLRSF